MKFTRLLCLVITVSASLILWSCGGSANKDENSKDFKDAEESLKDQVQGLIYNIPSPSEIPYLLQATGAEFNQGLVHDRRKADSYVNNDKAALNLGVYATDIGYLSSYEKTQEAIDYLNTAKGLADRLGIVGSFDVEVLKKFESNIGDKDSLASLLNRAVQKTDDYLKDDSRHKLAAFLLTGSFVEGLYISTGLIESYPKNLLAEEQRNNILTPLMRVVLQQEESVDELIKMLSTVEEEGNDFLAGIKTDLTALQASYRALNIEEQIKNNRGDLVLTDKNLVDITNIVKKIRKSITD